MIILHRFCMVSLENRTRQVARALLDADDGEVLLPDERTAQMYGLTANQGSHDRYQRVDGDLLIRLLEAELGYRPTLEHRMDVQRSCYAMRIFKHMGYTPREGPIFDEHVPDDEAKSEPKEDPGPFFGFDGSSDHTHWTYGGPYNTGETFNMRFTYTMAD